MFGYVRPPIKVLPQEETDRFQRMYCGLCHTLGNRYGTAARFILNYDFTYLAILISDREEGEADIRRCVAHPMEKRTFLRSTSAMELAADESVILAYWQLRDGVEDHDWLHGLKYRSLSMILEPAYQKAAALRPAFDQAVRRQLERLRELEGENSSSIDRAADAFAVLLGSAAGDVEDPIHRRILEQILYHLGRWIYLVDAADDLKQDAESGNYNPVALRFALENGMWTPEKQQEFAVTLDHSIHMIDTAFELWDFGVWRPILEQTFYNSLFAVGKSVLDGTYHKQKRDTERNKLGEETT